MKKSRLMAFAILGLVSLSELQAQEYWDIAQQEYIQPGWKKTKKYARQAAPYLAAAAGTALLVGGATKLQHKYWWETRGKIAKKAKKARADFLNEYPEYKNEDKDGSLVITYDKRPYLFPISTLVALFSVDPRQAGQWLFSAFFKEARKSLSVDATEDPRLMAKSILIKGIYADENKEALNDISQYLGIANLKSLLALVVEEA